VSDIGSLGVVAVMPFWSNSDNLNTDSNYVFVRVVLPELSKLMPHSVILLFFPDPAYGRDKWYYTPDGLQSDRIRFISWPYDTAMRSSVLGFSTERFGEIETDYAPVVYWLHQVESGASMKGGFKQHFNYASQPSIVAQHHYIIHKSLPYPFEGMFPRLWHQMGGSIAADAVVYNSDHCISMARDSFGMYLNSQQMDQLEKKSQVLRFGLLRGDEPQAPNANGDEPPIVLYNHRFENYKQPKTTFAVLDSLREAHNFRVWATQVSGQDTKSYNIDEFLYEPNRASYLARCAVPAINTINSIHETFCISILDSLAMGHLVVLPNALTFPELVPPDYPYLFKNEVEQEAMLSSIMANWPDSFNEWSNALSTHARENFNVEAYARRYLEVLELAESRYRRFVKKDHIQVAMDRFFASFKVGEEYDLLTAGRKCRRNAKLSDQACPNRRVTREAMMYGGIGVKWADGGIRLYRYD